jgi:tRNA pseudouridine55 synthase
MTAGDVDGILLYDKPTGISSNGALQGVRRLLGARKAGHTGSLDPLASGVLPLCFGEATKVSGYLLGSDKRYRARLILGARTESGDREGEIVERAAVPAMTRERLAAATASLTGSIKQVPPMRSALKHQGERLYALSRRGLTVEREARPVTIHALTVLSVDEAGSAIEFEVHCSKGTYIRTLGEDLARALGTVGHLASLRRTEVSPFLDARLYTLEDLEAHRHAGTLLNCLLPLDAALPDWPRFDIDGDEARAIRHGRAVNVAGAAPGVRARVYHAGVLLALGVVSPPGTRLTPLRVFRENSRPTGPAATA